MTVSLTDKVNPETLTPNPPLTTPANVSCPEVYVTETVQVAVALVFPPEAAET